MPEAVDSEATVSETGVLVAVCSCVVFIGLSTTAMNTAVGDMAEDFDMSTTVVAWAVNAYLLAAAAVVAPAGQFCDAYGRKRLFWIGLGVFFVASIVTASAPNSLMLIVGRALQGTGSALLMPAMLSILRVVYPRDRQGAAIGVWAAVASFTFAVGPLYGGLWSDTLSWRWIFWADLVLVGVTALLTIRYIRPVREAGRGTGADWTGAVLLGLAVLSVVTVLQQGSSWGWTSAAVLGMIALAVVLSTVFVAVELRVRLPLVHFPLFRIPQYSAGVITTFAQGFVLIGYLYFVSIYLESYAVYDDSPLDAGLVMFPAGFAMFVSALVGGRIADRVGYRGPNTFAMVLMAVGALVLVPIDSATSVGVLAALVCLMAAGVGVAFSTTSAAGMAAVDAEVSGEAAGVINMSRYLGAVLVVSIGTIVMVNVSTSVLESSLDEMGVEGTEALDLEDSMSETSQQLQQAISDVAPGQQSEVEAAVADATTDGFRGAAILVAIVSALAAIASWVLLEPRRETDEKQDHRGPVVHPPIPETSRE